MTQIEYKDRLVPLDVWGKAGAGPTTSKDTALRQAAINASPQAMRMIAAVLDVEAASGWQPDEATDLPSLLLEGRAVWRQTGGIMLSWKFTFDSVTIRFRRSELEVASAPMPARLCDQCGSPMGAEARFCASCGAAIAAGSAAEAKAPGSARCSFCGKSRSEVRVLVSGRGAYICDECIKLNQELTAP
jgi:hypothetical protein